MNVRKSLMTGLLATSISLGGVAALAQDSTPEASPEVAISEPGENDIVMGNVAVLSADGKIVGYARIWEGESGVTFTLESSSESILAPGKHGLHIHETGVCDADGEKPFDSAGGHFNPTDEMHGDINADPSHGGDLGNIEVAEDGSFVYQVTTEKVTLDPSGEGTLADRDGSAIVIHAGEDDLATDPSGESGDREACGVIFRSLVPGATPVASPAASPEATPGN